MPALLADWVVGAELWKAAAAANVVATTAKVTVLMMLLLGRRIGDLGTSLSATALVYVLSCIGYDALLPCIARWMDDGEAERKSEGISTSFYPMRWSAGGGSL